MVFRTCKAQLPEVAVLVRLSAPLAVTQMLSFRPGLQAGCCWYRLQITGNVLFTPGLKILGRPSHIPTATLSAFKIVNNTTYHWDGNTIFVEFEGAGCRVH